MTTPAEIAVETVSARHWRLLWGDNALDVMLREPTSGQVEDGRTFYTRLAARSALPAADADPVFAAADGLRRIDADLRVGPRRAPVAWDGMDMQRVDGGVLVTLTSRTVPLRAEIALTVEASGTLIREMTLVHAGEGAPVIISGAPTLGLVLADTFATASFLSGEWGEETQLNTVPLAHTPIYLESRSGKTGFEYNPWIALQAEGTTLVAQLLWSGNWYLSARRGPGATYLSGGLPELGLAHELRPGERLALPRMAIARVAGDLDAATHALHDYRRATRPDPGRNVPVQFNSWYPHPGEPDVAKMLELVPIARRLDCEVFVLDAGWYTTEHETPAENWWTRTGDWIVNRRLFPDGLQQLSNACREAGLGFGIWFEPEAISPSSIIRTEHPDWLHHPDGRPPAADKRAILNLGIDAAREFARDRIVAILRATDASWMKWDFNTDLRQGGWAPGVAAERDPLVAHYRGLYRLQDEIRAAFPELTLEMCASGGGRFDGEIMSHAHTNWMSDQKQPLRNLSIHFGSQLAHPPVACNDWLIEWPPNSIEGHMSRGASPDDRGDLAFRLRVAMLGAFGISAPVDTWSEAELDVAARHVRWYREHVRPRINTADQYRLTGQPPLDGRGDWAAMWYADKDRAGGVGFFFRLEGAAQRSFALPGLVPGRRYQLQYLDGQTVEATGAELSAGLVLTLDENFTSAVVAVAAAD